MPPPAGAGAAGESGFTLLEIMLVVLLIAIMATFVNLTLAPDPGRIVLREGERIAALIRQLQEESVLRGRPMSVVVDEDEGRYAFFVNESDAWEPLAGIDLFRPRVIPRPLTVMLDVQGASGRAPDSDADAGREEEVVGSRIVVDPVGEITPFLLILSAENLMVKVMLDEFHDLTVTQAESR